MKLLLIEDDKESAKYLIKGLREHGYVVDHSVSGKDGMFMAASEKYDAMIDAVRRALAGNAAAVCI